MDSWSKHEMVKEELALALEKIGQASTAIRTFEEVFFVNHDHREPAAFRSKGVPDSSSGFFLDQQFFSGRRPFLC